ncbi:MAG: MFS transporter, partial [Pseudomonadota bacterium]
GFVLFVIPSVLVSLAITPILLSISPVPAFDTTKPMTLRELFHVSPLGCVGMFLLGGVFAAQFGMAPVYGTEAQLSIAQISTFVSTFFIGAVLLQYPIGWLSDRFDRRLLILAVAVIGTVGSILGLALGGNFGLLLASAFIVGGMSNPLYSLLLAHTNDFLDHDDMAAASGGLVFINGLGAVAGPLIVGALMERVGPGGFYMFTAVLFAVLVGYAGYRMTQRATIAVEDTGAYVAMSQATMTPVAMEIAQEYAIDVELEAENPADAA